MTYFVLFVNFFHAPITLIFSDDLTGILHNDLVCIEASVTSYTITAILSLDDFDADSVFASKLASFS